MNVSEHDLPWKHLVIDNFLEPDVFLTVKNYVLSKYDLYNHKKPTVEIHVQTSNSLLYNLLSPVILDLKDKYFDLLNYGNKVIPEKFYTYAELAICTPGFKYPYIHQDVERKIMTTVLYVAPDDGDGTDLYSKNNKKSLIKSVEWKPNRAISFVSQRNPKLQETWHNYGNSKPFCRASINMILSSTPNGKY
jgi:hypothetical protein